MKIELETKYESGDIVKFKAGNQVVYSKIVKIEIEVMAKPTIMYSMLTGQRIPEGSVLEKVGHE